MAAKRSPLSRQPLYFNRLPTRVKGKFFTSNLTASAAGQALAYGLHDGRPCPVGWQAVSGKQSVCDFGTPFEIGVVRLQQRQQQQTLGGRSLGQSVGRMSFEWHWQAQSPVWAVCRVKVMDVARIREGIPRSVLR